MNASACLQVSVFRIKEMYRKRRFNSLLLAQAFIGTLYTYLCFYYGTKHVGHQAKYAAQFRRIEANRCRGQPYVCTFAGAWDDDVRLLGADTRLLRLLSLYSWP